MWRCCLLSVYKLLLTSNRIPVTAFSSARAHDCAAGGSSAAGGDNAPYLLVLAALSRVAMFRHTVPMAGIARNGSDSTAPIIAIGRVVLFVGKRWGAEA